MIEALGWLCCGALAGGIVGVVVGFAFGARCGAEATRRTAERDDLRKHAYTGPTIPRKPPMGARKFDA